MGRSRSKPTLVAHPQIRGSHSGWCLALDLLFDASECEADAASIALQHRVGSDLSYIIRKEIPCRDC